jgi:transcriptional regulator with XRE-family HTH domain
MTDSYYSSKARAESLEEMRKNRDQEGLRRLEFGRTLYNLRRLVSPDFSQRQAAERAGLTRPQWNKIENGKVRPLLPTIPKIAAALDIDPNILFKLAGYEVPEKYSFYDKKHARRRLDTALESSISKAEFFAYMEVVWEEYQAQLMKTLPPKIGITPAYADLFSLILEHLSFGARLQLAMELVDSSSHKVAETMKVSYVDFYEMIGNKLEEYRNRYMGLENEDFII